MRLINCHEKCIARRIGLSVGIKLSAWIELSVGIEISVGIELSVLTPKSESILTPG